MANVNDPRLVATELWGGPLDGKWVEALPDNPVTVYCPAGSSHMEWYPYIPTLETVYNWRYVGFYQWRPWGIQRRLEWSPL